MINIQRDNKITNLKNEIYTQLSDIIKMHYPTHNMPEKVNNVTQISVEDAIKELIAMGVQV